MSLEPSLSPRRWLRCAGDHPQPMWHSVNTDRRWLPGSPRGIPLWPRFARSPELPPDGAPRALRWLTSSLIGRLLSSLLPTLPPPLLNEMLSLDSRLSVYYWDVQESTLPAGATVAGRPQHPSPQTSLRSDLFLPSCCCPSPRHQHLSRGPRPASCLAPESHHLDACKVTLEE